MKKSIWILLAVMTLLSLASCAGKESTQTTAAAYSTPAVRVTASDSLTTFFGGDADGAIQKLSGTVCAFACAVQQYPQSLTEVPGSNFGWAFVYDMLMFEGVTADGITSKNGTVTVTADAFAALQKSTLGGAAWNEAPNALADYVSYDADKAVYTLKPGFERPFAAYVESAEYRDDVQGAQLTVAVYSLPVSGTEVTVAGRYAIVLRASDDGTGFVIASFAKA